MNDLIIINCPCCNNKITINKVTGETSSDFSYEQNNESNLPNYEFGEKEVVANE